MAPVLFELNVNNITNAGRQGPAKRRRAGTRLPAIDTVATIGMGGRYAVAERLIASATVWRIVAKL